MNFVDVEGLKKGGLSPATCIVLAAMKTNPSIDKCRTMIWDAYYDQVNGNQDYSKMCSVGDPSTCSLGCVSTDFWNNLASECTGNGLDLKKVKMKKVIYILFFFLIIFLRSKVYTHCISHLMKKVL
ncbi:hypothetical protein BN3087_940001 [Sulfurovum sp. enrichment culture clone C5]|uniref:Uncharacterized protein n=1 Tax=Sulfurovum sp. enrichment culture clone C5 TaxID=497650 RepID=A0A0S4XRG2_9BACT|nr:hypothetical protein BN3087_940001 [Sulfurovum sp. enrichment culture clone C5]